MNKGYTRLIRCLAGGIMFLICQGFECEDDTCSAYYIGGIVRDAVTRQPVSNVAIGLANREELVRTDTNGKFGLLDETMRNQYTLYFRDCSDVPAYACFDTLVYPKNGKVLIEIFLRKH